MVTQIEDDPFWWPSEMVADRREMERLEMQRKLDQAFAAIEAQRRIEEEIAWAEHEMKRGNHGASTD